MTPQAQGEELLARVNPDLTHGVGLTPPLRSRAATFTPTTRVCGQCWKQKKSGKLCATDLRHDREETVPPRIPSRVICLERRPGTSSDGEHIG